MRKSEQRIREAFEELSKRIPPQMLSDLVYGFTPEDENGKSFVDYDKLVGFIDTASKFEINHVHEGERALKVRIVNSLYATIDLLEDTIQRLK